MTKMLQTIITVRAAQATRSNNKMYQFISNSITQDMNNGWKDIVPGVIKDTKPIARLSMDVIVMVTSVLSLLAFLSYWKGL